MGRSRVVRPYLPKPAHGWALVTSAAQALGIWGELGPDLAARCFSLACHKVIPEVERNARATEVKDAGTTLIVSVSSGAAGRAVVASTPSLLRVFNEEAAKISGPRGQRAVAIERLAVVLRASSSVRSLPGHSFWAGGSTAPRQLPAQGVRPDVAVELAQVADPELRKALTRLYVKICG